MSRFPVFRHARWVAAAVTLGGCVGGSGTPSPSPGVTTIAAPPVVAGGGVGGVVNGAALAPLPPVGAATTTIVRTSYQLGLDTPEAAAKNLWDAWRDDDRTRARMAADENAVRSLFEDVWGPEVDEQGCIPVIADLRYRCAYVQGNAARILEVNAVAGRYRVTGLQRIGELATSSGPQAGNRPGPVGGPTTVPFTRPPRPRPRAKTATTPGASPVEAEAGTAQDTKAPVSTRQRVRTTEAPPEPDPAPPPADAPVPVPVQARAAGSSVGQ